MSPEARPTKPSLAAGAVAACILAAARLLPLPGADGSIGHLPSVCLFHQITGLPCPGCGMTRSFVCIAHGRFAEAFAYHPLGPIAFALCALVAARGVLQWILPGLPQFSPPSSLTRTAAYAGLAVVMAAWVARLAGWDALPN